MKRSSGIRQVGMAATLLASMFGRFGATKDTSPEMFDAAATVEGYRGGVRKRDVKSSSHGIIKDRSRWVAQYKARHDYHSPQERFDKYEKSTIAGKVAGSLRGSEWLKMNRLRRAAGLPQLRAV